MVDNNGYVRLVDLGFAKLGLILMPQMKNQSPKIVIVCCIFSFFSDFLRDAAILTINFSFYFLNCKKSDSFREVEQKFAIPPEPSRINLANKGTLTYLRRKNDKISDFVYFVWVIFL